MNYIEKCLFTVKDILSTQPVEECRKNVLETIVNLEKECPKQKTDIDAKFKEICKECNVDLFEEIDYMNYIDKRLEPVKEILETQPKDWRRNAIETIEGLKNECPKQKEYIDAKFKEMCL